MFAGIVSFFLGTRTGRYVLIGLAIVVAAGVAVLIIYNRGYEAAAAAAAAEVLRRGVIANQARDKVRHDQKAIDNDPDNRNRL